MYKAEYRLASEGGNMEVAEREEPRGALDGMRVLDVAEPCGAYVSRILGDLGADVIKIEPPEGDPGRQMAPLLPVGAERLSLPFVHANLNKRSIVLDVRQPQDQERFRALARQADVVVSTEGVTSLGHPWGGPEPALHRFPTPGLDLHDAFRSQWTLQCLCG